MLTHSKPQRVIIQSWSCKNENNLLIILMIISMNMQMPVIGKVEQVI